MQPFYLLSSGCAATSIIRDNLETALTTDTRSTAMALQPFSPIEKQLDGLSTIYEYRAPKEIDIFESEHLACVNFQPQQNATYTYEGAPDWHGTRQAGMAQVVEPWHKTTGFVAQGTDHVMLKLKHSWLSDLALKAFDASTVELVSDGIPYQDEQLHRLYTLIRDELVGEGEPLMLDSLGVAVGIHLLRTTSTLSKPKIERRSALSPRKLALVKEYIRVHLDSEITLAKLATLVELSPDHFWRCFRSETGITPHEYLMQVKIERVTSLLSNPSTTLAEASFLAGFSSQSHMTRVFRKHIGTTPGRWRKSIQ